MGQAHVGEDGAAAQAALTENATLPTFGVFPQFDAGGRFWDSGLPKGGR